ncbi:MAG: hypothetical protein LBJ31_11010 [Treponema sp.]|jgi:hypothetical protein|nr:hypothetical protein [Treponema sp.]
MIKPELYLNLEIGSDTKNISMILDMLPNNIDGVKYYNIGDIRERDNGVYKESFYRYRYYDHEAFYANMFVERLLEMISLERLKKIISFGFDVLLVFNILFEQQNDFFSIPDAGLSAKLMKTLGDLGIDYHVNIDFY